MAGLNGLFRYVSDTGKNYKVRMDRSNAAAMGCVAADLTELDPPKGLVMRLVHFRDFTDSISRSLPVCSNANGFFTGATTTASLPDFEALAVKNFNTQGRTGEKCRGDTNC